MEPGQEWTMWVFFLAAAIILGLGAFVKWAVASGIQRFNKKFGIEVKDNGQSTKGP